MNNSGQLFLLALATFIASSRACFPTLLMLAPLLLSTLWLETQMIYDSDKPAHYSTENAILLFMAFTLQWNSHQFQAW